LSQSSASSRPIERIGPLRFSIGLSEAIMMRALTWNIADTNRVATTPAAVAAITTTSIIHL
jgi:hypothetical protein